MRTDNSRYLLFLSLIWEIKNQMIFLIVYKLLVFTLERYYKLEKTMIPWILFVPQKIPQEWNNYIDRLQRRHGCHDECLLTKEL